MFKIIEKNTRREDRVAEAKQPADSVGRRQGSPPGAC